MLAHKPEPADSKIRNIMKTTKRKESKKILSISEEIAQVNASILELTEWKRSAWNKVKNFTLSYEKALELEAKIRSLNSEIKSAERRKKKLQSQLIVVENIKAQRA